MTGAPPPLARARSRAASAWSRSLVLRTVLTTLALAIVVVGLVAVALLNSVTGGLIDAKQSRSLTEATADWEQSLRILAAADAGASTASPEWIVDGLLADLARNAGSPPAYELLLLQPPEAPITGPERASNLISPSSVPDALQVAVAVEGSQQWTSSTARYLDGSSEPAMVVGAPVDVPGVGGYQLFHVFPYSEEQQITTLVRSATLLSGALLVVLLVAVVWLVTRQVAVPIRQTARTAFEISEGDLDRRIPVSGSDETAQLANSFNAMADSVQQQITELETLSRVQQRFVSDVSHELRTPLTTIRMASDVLHDRRDLVDQDTGRAIELLATQVDRFESLLADLLEISRIDANAADLDAEDLDLSALVGSILAAAEPLAAERGSRLSCTMPPTATVVADPRRIARIIRNLISNALEFGGGTPTEVLVATDGSAAAVGVRDHGPGLDAEGQHRAFDRFWRADPSRTRTLGGTGLGLSISLEDALLHNGALECVSTPGQGTLFVLTIAVEPSSAASASRPVPVDLAAFDAAMRPGSEPADGSGTEAR